MVASPRPRRLTSFRGWYEILGPRGIAVDQAQMTGYLGFAVIIQTCGDADVSDVDAQRSTARCLVIIRPPPCENQIRHDWMRS